ncbi:hypothetical protein ARMSODRAFT_982887 [Armillaria solidipes]|uniref:F-box domain-containing protein n=1 Tax=Armillaria solidipes TaxID=1076256 RepID=A0A2H3ALF4_9AGAR|nr:hypothetical protein ARMSODRAFT_982887 [Armillaria solidipes]
MTSTKRSTCAFLSDLLSRFNLISASSRSPELIALLSTNVIPTAFQAAQLKASIEVLDAPITEIQSEIDLLRNVAASLETKMERLTDIRRDYRAALSAIRRLPTEILVEILRWTSKEKTQVKDPGPYRVFGFNVFKIGAGPWYLGQVCSSWRDAVRLLCPEIWSTLEITWLCKRSEKEDSMAPAPKKDMVALLDWALERSQNRRLDFYFRCWGFDKEDSADQVEEPEEMIQCFDLLLTHSKRWGSVKLALVPSFLSRLSLVRGRVDRVEDVYLTCIPDAMPGTVDAFEIAPKLKTLDLTGMHADAYIPFPADNLVLLSDGRPLPDHDMIRKYLDIIASAPNLFEFSYHHFSSAVPESPGPYHPQIVHQSLQRLSTSLGALIDSLVVPSLTWMTLTSVESYRVIMCPRDALSHLYSLVVRSHCSLTTLTFIDAILDENLIPILRLSPQLISLCFECKQPSRESDATLRSLFVDMSETIRVGDALHYTLLPCLKRLEFTLYNVEYYAVKYLDVEFVDMVVSRRVPLGSQRLEILRILVEGRAFQVPFTDNGGLEKLQRLRDDGLDLQLDLDDWIFT